MPQFENVAAAISQRQRPITNSAMNIPSVAVVWIQAVL